MVTGKVVVRAAFNQGWRGDKYEQDDIMPATEKQAQRLTQSGQAYYDFEPDTEPDKPTMQNTKKEIEAYLEDAEIEYDEYATKSELLELFD